MLGAGCGFTRGGGDGAGLSNIHQE